jgi:hypothetical protein
MAAQAIQYIADRLSATFGRRQFRRKRHDQMRHDAGESDGDVRRVDQGGLGASDISAMVAARIHVAQRHERQRTQRCTRPECTSDDSRQCCPLPRASARFPIGEAGCGHDCDDAPLNCHGFEIRLEDGPVQVRFFPAPATTCIRPCRNTTLL